MDLKLLGMVKNGDVENIKRYIDANLEFEDYESTCLQMAVGRGNLEMVKLLLPYSNPLSMGKHIFEIALAQNHLDIFDVMLGKVEKTDQKTIFSLAKDAVHYGRDEALLKILPMLDELNSNDNDLIFSATNIETLKLIIPYSKQMQIEKMVIYLINNPWVFNDNTKDAIDILWEHCDAHRTKSLLKDIEIRYGDDSLKDYLDYLINIRETKEKMDVLKKDKNYEKRKRII